MFAMSVCPAERSAATTSACDVPAGNCAPSEADTTPSKMTFVASPSTLGAMTASTTPIAPSSDTKPNAHL